MGTSINIAPEEGHFDFSEDTARHTTGFALWIEAHNLALEKDRVQSSRVGSEAELIAILDSGLSFSMPLPLIGASEGLAELERTELVREYERQKQKAQEEILKAQEEQAKALKEEEQKTAEITLALAEEALRQAELEEQRLAEEKAQKEQELLEKEEAEKKLLEEKLLADSAIRNTASIEEKDVIIEEKLQDTATKPIALDNLAEKETTATSLEDTTVVIDESKKAFPVDLPSDNVDMIQYSIQKDGNDYVALFTLFNKGTDTQAGNITFSISFEDGETMPFVGYVGTYRFKLQVPKNYLLRMSAPMLEHAKVSAPRMITIYLQNNRDEVFFRKNIMITN